MPYTKEMLGAMFKQEGAVWKDVNNKFGEGTIVAVDDGSGKVLPFVDEEGLGCCVAFHQGEWPGEIIYFSQNDTLFNLSRLVRVS